jgi:hypothetical protein
MASILQDNPKVGAVSPRSNNASLTTVPISTAIQKGINLSKAYKVYEAIKSDLPRYYEAADCSWILYAYPQKPHC